MFHIDGKFWIVAVLFAALVFAKLFAGGRPYDAPVRRKRRFGYRGTQGPLAQPGARERAAEPVDPEKEFFGEK